MRKCLTLMLCLLLVFGLAGCGGSDQGADNKVKKSAGVDEVLEAGVEAEDKEEAAEEEKEEQEELADGSQSALEEDNSSAVSTESSQEGQADQTDLNVKKTDGIDVDLTTLSSTMVYSEVYNMVTTPDNYKGLTVKMKGTAASIQDESTGKYYYACIIQDATACCSQGIEYELDGVTGPDGYPADEEEITVVGVFDTYEEAGMVYCTLKNARLLK